MEEEKTSQNENLGKITINEFAKLVKEMRFNQKRYFRLRKPDILETCKKLEKQVDDIVSELTDSQMKLF